MSPHRIYLRQIFLGCDPQNILKFWSLCRKRQEAVNEYSEPSDFKNGGKCKFPQQNSCWSSGCLLTMIVFYSDGHDRDLLNTGVANPALHPFRLDLQGSTSLDVSEVEGYIRHKKVSPQGYKMEFMVRSYLAVTNWKKNSLIDIRWMLFLMLHPWLTIAFTEYCHNSAWGTSQAICIPSPFKFIRICQLKPQVNVKLAAGWTMWGRIDLQILNHVSFVSTAIETFLLKCHFPLMMKNLILHSCIIIYVSYSVDSSRVVLTTENEPESDYINASFIKVRNEWTTCMHVQNLYLEWFLPKWQVLFCYGSTSIMICCDAYQMKVIGEKSYAPLCDYGDYCLGNTDFSACINPTLQHVSSWVDVRVLADFFIWWSDHNSEILNHAC